MNEIIEECYSGKTSDRDGLNHLRELVNGGKVESVIVMKLDRLMRSFTEGVVFIKYLMDNDVKIVSVMEQIDTSSVNGRFLINILLSVSDLERTTIDSKILPVPWSSISFVLRVMVVRSAFTFLKFMF